MKNVSIYFNERSSHFDEKLNRRIHSAFFRSSLEFKNPSNLDQLKNELEIDLLKRKDAVFCIGGDGTMNQIIQKLVGTEMKLFVIPSGTANDLAFSLGNDSNVKNILHTFRENLIKKIDVISINNRFMATNGGLGFASDIAIEINNLRQKYPSFKNFMKISGSNIYTIFLAKKLLSSDIASSSFRFTSEEFSGTVTTSLILINNQEIFAGSFNVAPETRNDDGRMNVMIFKHTNKIELIQTLLQIIKNIDVSNDKNIISFETSKINITQIDGEIKPFFGDGEKFDLDSSWNIEVHPKALNVFYASELKKLPTYLENISIH